MCPYRHTHHLATFRRYRTAREAWIPRDLLNLRMGRTERMIQYFNRGKTIFWELDAVLDATFDDGQLISAPRMGLPGKYELRATVLVAQRNMV